MYFIKPWFITVFEFLSREAISWTLPTNANREKKKILNENSYALTIIDGINKVKQIETVWRREIIEYTL